MSPAHLVKKLGIKPGMRMLIVAAPTRYLESLAPLPDGAQLAAAEDGPFAFVQLFVTDAADLGLHASKLLTEAGENALVWITYPKIRSKLASELSRDKVRAILSDLGWRAVAIVAIDEVWSALRFRPMAESTVATERQQAVPTVLVWIAPLRKVGMDRAPFGKLPG
jgi:hypothetical protein